MSVFRSLPGIALILSCAAAQAADFAVTRFDDSNPPQPGMLRAAVAAANACLLYTSRCV